MKKTNNFLNNQRYTLSEQVKHKIIFESNNVQIIFNSILWVVVLWVILLSIFALYILVNHSEFLAILIVLFFIDIILLSIVYAVYINNKMIFYKYNVFRIFHMRPSHAIRNFIIERNHLPSDYINTWGNIHKIKK